MYLRRNNNCTYHNDVIFCINYWSDNCSDSYHRGHYCFNFHHQNHNDNDDYDNWNDNLWNHNSDNFSLNNNYIHRASDNDYDSIHALDDQLDAILHCLGS